jgi:hypothetical protein
MRTFAPRRLSRCMQPRLRRARYALTTSGDAEAGQSEDLPRL